MSPCILAQSAMMEVTPSPCTWLTCLCCLQRLWGSRGSIWSHGKQPSRSSSMRLAASSFRGGASLAGERSSSVWQLSGANGQW